eukprot:3826522-Rhodomonas_salina.2
MLTSTQLARWHMRDRPGTRTGCAPSDPEAAAPLRVPWLSMLIRRCCAIPSSNRLVSRAPSGTGHSASATLHPVSRPPLAFLVPHSRRRARLEKGSEPESGNPCVRAARCIANARNDVEMLPWKDGYCRCKAGWDRRRVPQPVIPPPHSLLEEAYGGTYGPQRAVSADRSMHLHTNFPHLTQRSCCPRRIAPGRATSGYS